MARRPGKRRVAVPLERGGGSAAAGEIVRTTLSPDRAEFRRAPTQVERRRRRARRPTVTRTGAGRPALTSRTTERTTTPAPAMVAEARRRTPYSGPRPLESARSRSNSPRFRPCPTPRRLRCLPCPKRTTSSRKCRPFRFPKRNGGGRWFDRLRGEGGTSRGSSSSMRKLRAFLIQKEVAGRKTLQPIRAASRRRARALFPPARGPGRPS
jgi:hypothetical protein